MTIQDLDRYIEIKIAIDRLERTDIDRQEVLASNPYAVNEGYVSRNMEIIEHLEDELAVLRARYQIDNK